MSSSSRSLWFTVDCGLWMRYGDREEALGFLRSSSLTPFFRLVLPFTTNTWREGYSTGDPCKLVLNTLDKIFQFQPSSYSVQGGASAPALNRGILKFSHDTAWEENTSRILTPAPRLPLSSAQHLLISSNAHTVLKNENTKMNKLII